MILTYLFIGIGCRILADLLVELAILNLRYNHYRLPQMGWKREALEFTIALSIMLPILRVLP